MKKKKLLYAILCALGSGTIGFFANHLSEVYGCVVFGLGVAVGVTMKNIPICMSVGLSVGMCVGVMIDYINSNKKEKDK